MFGYMTSQLVVPRAHCVLPVSLSLESTQKVAMSTSVSLTMHPPIPHSTHVKLVYPSILMALEINNILIVSDINLGNKNW